MIRRLCLFLFLLSANLHAQVYQSTLPNGLKMLIQPDHRAPVAIVMIWYKVGSADEIGGATGLAHALEHMMFKGTPTHPPGTFSKTIAALGGQENAFTAQDYTAYFEKINSHALETALSLEADRMQHLIITEEEFNKEIKVIREERRLRVDDRPQALALERFMASAYLTPAYQHPVIGWMDDLMRLEVDELRQWYQNYYAPNNATLVIIGDVDPRQVEAMAAQYFGPIPSKTIPPRHLQQEPQALGAKQVNINTPAQQPILLLGYTAPSINYAALTQQSPKDAYALEVIAGLLDAGENGRLTRSLIHTKHMAATVSAFYDLYTRLQNQFILFAIPTETHSVTELKSALLNEIHRLQTERVTPQELTRIQTQLIAQNTFGLDSLFNQAMKMGLLETIGLDYRVADAYPDQIRAITADDVQAAAKKFLCDACLTQATLLPEMMNKG